MIKHSRVEVLAAAAALGAIALGVHSSQPDCRHQTVDAKAIGEQIGVEYILPYALGGERTLAGETNLGMAYHTNGKGDRLEVAFGPFAVGQDTFRLIAVDQSPAGRNESGGTHLDGRVDDVYLQAVSRMSKNGPRGVVLAESHRGEGWTPNKVHWIGQNLLNLGRGVIQQQGVNVTYEL